MGLIDFLYGGKKLSDVPFWVYNYKNGDKSYGLIDFLYGGRKMSDVPYWVFNAKRKAHQERLKKEQLEEILSMAEEPDFEESEMYNEIIDDYIMDKVRKTKHNKW